MKCGTRAGLWLAALGIALAPSARSAVMTGNVQVTSGAAPYLISYSLAQDATSMTINIRKSSDNSIVRTLSGSAIPDSAKLAGPHTAEVTWDGKTTGGAAAPNGSYYAEVVTSGAAVPALTLLHEPTQLTDPTDGTAFDGRNYYGSDVNRNPASPAHNLLYDAVTNSSGSGRVGVAIVAPDTTTVGFSNAGAPNSALDFMSASVLSDNSVVLTGQQSGSVVVTDANGVRIAAYGAPRIVTRMSQAFGTKDKIELFAVGGGSPGGSVGGVEYFADVNGYTSTSTPLVLVPAASLPASGRVLVVNKDKTALWVAGSSGVTAATDVRYVWKFNITKDANGNITGATKDPNWNWAGPPVFETGANMRGLALSPDESVLWYSINEGGTSSPVTSRIVAGVDAATGADKGPNYRIDSLSFHPQDLSPSSNGNLYVTTYASLATGTTSNAVALLAPPDNGSSDTTRSPDFVATADVNIQVTNVQVTNVTYHGATISWDTNFASDAAIDYGTAPGFPDQTATKAESTTHHSITLDNLTSATKYYFVVRSNEPGFNEGRSAELSFTTTGPLAISNVQVQNITDTSALVTFKTNEPGLGIVRYSRSPSGYEPDLVIGDARHPGEYSSDTVPGTAAPLSTDHSILITGLSPNVTYYFSAESGYQPTGTTAIFKTRPTYEVHTAEATFKTLNTISLTEAGLAATQNSATLSFTTDPAAAAVVKWGSAPDALTNTVNVPSGTGHSAQLTGLSAGTTYYYTVELSAAGAATRTTPVNTLVTAVAGGTATTLTQNKAADFGLANRSQIVLGGQGGLIQLEKQGVPGQPVEGAALPGPIRYSGVVALNGYIYSIGGYNGTASVSTVYYAPINADGSIGAWATTEALPTVKGFIANMCVAYGGYLYAIGDGLEVHYTRPNADGTLQPWKNTTPLPENRDIGSTVAVDGVIYVMGGEVDGDDPAPSVLQAPINGDGTLGAWSRRSYTKDGFYLQRALANAHRVYTFGGLTDAISANYAVADVNTVDIAKTQPMQDLTPFLRNTDDLGHFDGLLDALHYSMGAALLRGKIVSLGGRVETANYHNMISYGALNADGSTGPWVTWAPDDSLGSLPFSVRDQDATAYNGVAYSIGGRVSDGSTTNRTVYIPFVDDPSQTGYAYAGNLDSPIIDLGSVSNLKQLTVVANGAGVEVRYRFANTDGVFTPWFTAARPDAPISGGARYFQYQIVLTGNGSTTPTVSSVGLTIEPGVPGQFNKTDVQTALKAAGGLVTVSAADKTRLDVDGDGSVTLKDAVAIEKQVANP